MSVDSRHLIWWATPTTVLYYHLSYQQLVLSRKDVIQLKGKIKPPLSNLKAFCMLCLEFQSNVLALVFVHDIYEIVMKHLMVEDSEIKFNSNFGKYEDLRLLTAFFNSGMLLLVGTTGEGETVDMYKSKSLILQLISRINLSKIKESVLNGGVNGIVLSPAKSQKYLQLGKQLYHNEDFDFKSSGKKRGVQVPYTQLTTSSLKADLADQARLAKTARNSLYLVHGNNMSRWEVKDNQVHYIRTDSVQFDGPLKEQVENLFLGDWGLAICTSLLNKVKMLQAHI